ncbi:hypothetical protein D1970_05075 [Mesobacillus zeae]|uniref:ABC transporter periplasmic binding protein yphF n=2 Tax=Mesobacillus zeae TaxID=1917180 RepID=A0A398BIU0_9BACI|nr:hypothetical protein D1970_05075 [Mesobacillus zeae]
MGVLLTGLMIATCLSGCMYPEENLAQNKIPYKDQVDSVQKAVEQYREDQGGFLPIKTKEADTPLYQKYPVDFQKIVPQYLPEIPGNAFENGGIFQYVMVDTETKPTVKLLDVRMAETIREIKMRINASGYPPFKKQLGKNVFTLDFKQLGYKEEPVAVSPYTENNLPFVISGEGEIYVDYRSDLYDSLKDTKVRFGQGDDIRSILMDDSLFVPAYSLPYTIDKTGKEPMFLEK